MTRPLRIFHLIKSLGRGGAEVLLSDGPRSSNPAKYRYAFGYFLPHKNALVEELEQIGPVTCFNAVHPARFATRIPELVRCLRSFGADVLHCHLPLAGVVGRLAGKLAGIPVVYTEHNAIERYHPATRCLARSTWRLQRRVVAVSGDVESSIHRHFGRHVPTQVIRNGVSLERFQRYPGERATARSELGADDATRLVGSVAVFRKQKRLDLWLEVAARICATRADTRFVLVGDGPLMPEVERRIQDAGLASRVLLTGLKQDVRKYLAALDIYLMTSDFEGVPIALLEAMAMECAPVTTDAGGIPEVIEDDHSGLVRRKGDVTAIEAAVVSLLDSPAKLRELGVNARERVSNNFSTRAMMECIESVYDGLV